MKILLVFAGFLFCSGLTPTQADVDKDWWKHTIVYQIYPRSFQDSDGNGVGDLNGIISRLDYFATINVETIWLSPIYPSPFADFGYDVSDYVDIDPLFGNLQDFDELVKEVHKRGMKLVMDFIPNHSSDQHVWFQASRLGGDAQENPYVDYYRWDAGEIDENGERQPPNNWLSIFGDSAWEWDEVRGQYYLHQFLKEQPDLNYRNPDVRRDMLNNIEFWMRRGVDGFRIDAIQTLFETEEVLGMDEPRSNREGFSERESDYLDHIYTLHQDEIHDVIREWRDMMDGFEKETGKHIYMVMEVYSQSMVDIMKYYHSGADQPFNFNLISVNSSCGGSCVKGLVDDFMTNMPEGGWPSQVLGNHDNKRITTRARVANADALNVMLLTLPGTPTTYYGEELAMRDVEVAFEDVQDPWGKNYGPDLYMKYTRDPCRAPMQWDSSKNAGFSDADKTWIVLNPDYPERNVQVQQNDPSGLSSLQIYRAAAALRRNPVFKSSTMSYHVVDDSIFSFVRYASNIFDEYLVVVNLGDGVEERDFSAPRGTLFKEGILKLTTVPDKIVGYTVALNRITLRPGEALVLKIMPPPTTADCRKEGL